MQKIAEKLEDCDIHKGSSFPGRSPYSRRTRIFAFIISCRIGKHKGKQALKFFCHIKNFGFVWKTTKKLE